MHLAPGQDVLRKGPTPPRAQSGRTWLQHRMLPGQLCGLSVDESGTPVINSHGQPGRSYATSTDEDSDKLAWIYCKAGKGKASWSWRRAMHVA